MRWLCDYCKHLKVQLPLSEDDNYYPYCDKGYTIFGMLARSKNCESVKLMERYK